MITQTIAANALPAAARIAAIAVLHILVFITFHGRLNLLLENNTIDIISEHIIAEFLPYDNPQSRCRQNR
jgi:hypothetical protein